MCNVSERVRRALGDRARAGSRAAAAERTGRALLSRLRAEEEALTQLRAGGPVIWAVYVTGAPDDVRRLGDHALVWSFEPVEFAAEEGQILVGVPRPAEPKPVGEAPTFTDIENLTPIEVIARLEQLAALPARDCAPIETAQRTVSGHWTVAALRDDAPSLSRTRRVVAVRATRRRRLPMR